MGLRNTRENTLRGNTLKVFSEDTYSTTRER
ncbi:hypothetical protein PPBDW_I20501 [Photobacterium kishitanii]|nr:hypothetical protein PPBDW_I20501 [Photobacterium kishitanii]